MYPHPAELVSRRPVRLWLLIGLLGLLAGCAGTGGRPAPGADTPGGASADRGPVVSKRSDKNRPRFEMNGDAGFTVTEVIRIGSDVRADYQRALGLLQREQLEEGIALLENVVERAPDLTAPYIDLGVAYGRMGDHEEAERSLQAALTRSPNHPAALNELGIVYRRTGKFDAARNSYERALDVHPGYHFALRNLGVLCDLYLEDLSCALANYERYAEIVVDDEQVAIWIADIRNRLAVGP